MPAKCSPCLMSECPRRGEMREPVGIHNFCRSAISPAHLVTQFRDSSNQFIVPEDSCYDYELVHESKASASTTSSSNSSSDFSAMRASRRTVSAEIRFLIMLGGTLMSLQINHWPA